MSIFLCPKAFRSTDDFAIQRDFLGYYLARRGMKALISDALWDAFRYRLTASNGEDTSPAIDGILAEMRGLFEPENLRTDKVTYEEIPADRDYSEDELTNATIDYLERNWADVETFITTTPEHYEEIIAEKNIRMITLEDFYLDCMNDHTTRELMEDFWNHNETEKYG
jgi:hypothetical protein